MGDKVVPDREAFSAALDSAANAAGLRLSAPERKSVLAALGERDPEAAICRDRRGNPEPDPELRDTETVPLREDVDAYVEREVLPHVPDAWLDESKTKIGYEIPLNRHFYVYEPPRPRSSTSISAPLTLPAESFRPRRWCSRTLPRERVDLSKRTTRSCPQSGRIYARSRQSARLRPRWWSRQASRWSVH